MKRWLLAIALFGLAAPALAQSVQQAPPVTPGHAAAWRANGVIGDAGSSSAPTQANAGGIFGGLNVLGGGCVEDGYNNLTLSPSGYHQLCLFPNSLGGGLISYNGFNGASPLPLNFNINGSSYAFPGAGSGNILGPNSSTVSHVPVWNNSSGTLLADPTGTTASTLLSNSGSYSNVSGNFTGSSASANIFEVLGTSGSPNTTQDSLALLQKFSNYTGPTSGGFSNSTLYVNHVKSGTAPNTRATAAIFETDDRDGWNGVGLNAFIEGVRAEAYLLATSSLGFADAVVASAGEVGGATHTTLVGAEGEIINRQIDATYTWNDGSPLDSGSGHFEASFLSTSSGSFKPFAGFMVNPFVDTALAYQVGFFCPSPQTAGHVAPVAGACFRSMGTSTWGIDLTQGQFSFGSIGLPNNIPVWAADSSGASFHNMMNLTSGNMAAYAADTSLAGATFGNSSIPSIFAGTSITVAATTFAVSGGTTLGSPTGGNKGAGTLNVQGTIWTNGTQGVASKTCTVNQALTLIFTNGILTGGTCNS